MARDQQRESAGRALCEWSAPAPGHAAADRSLLGTSSRDGGKKQGEGALFSKSGAVAASEGLWGLGCFLEEPPEGWDRDLRASKDRAGLAPVAWSSKSHFALLLLLAQRHSPSAHQALPVPASYLPQVSNGCVSKILGRYYRTGALEPKGIGGSKPRLATPPVVARIAQLKGECPALFAWEIQRQLCAEGLCTQDKTPSVSSINRVLRGLQEDQRLPWTQLNLPAVLAPVPPTLHSGSEAPRGPHPGTSHRNRTIFSPGQAEALEKEFQRGQYPDSVARGKLAAATSLPEDTVRIWFSNRRAKWRRQEKLKWEMQFPGAAQGASLPSASPGVISAQQSPGSVSTAVLPALESLGLSSHPLCWGTASDAPPQACLQPCWGCLPPTAELSGFGAALPSLPFLPLPPSPVLVPLRPCSGLAPHCGAWDEGEGSEWKGDGVGSI
ncbi:paired box protein Pax-4 [Sus scrofa]|uniref:paired box protein Pax-4 n=1 Tax=Sus scrofa TaxID=9823 RepID=UPI000A2B237F|nr:paired box protein Pax-4 [Sus scrofa]